MTPKGPPSFFLIFCNKLDFQKVERVPPCTILKTLRFLSLRYSADFRRSRLVFHYIYSGINVCVSGKQYWRVVFIAKKAIGSQGGSQLIEPTVQAMLKERQKKDDTRILLAAYEADVTVLAAPVSSASSSQQSSSSGMPDGCMTSFHPIHFQPMQLQPLKIINLLHFQLSAIST